MVEGADRVFLEIDHFEAVGLGGFFHFLGNGQRKQIIAREDGDLFHVRSLRFDDLSQRRGQRVIRREGAEKIFVALVVDLRRRRGRGDCRHLVFFGDGACCLGGSRAEGAEQEIDIVLRDHLLGGLHRARRIGLIIDIDDLNLVLLAANRNSPGLVGLLRPEIVTLLLFDALRRQGSGQRQRRTEAYDIVSRGRRRQNIPAKKGGNCSSQNNRETGKRGIGHSYLPMRVSIGLPKHRKSGGRIKALK